MRTCFYLAPASESFQSSITTEIPVPQACAYLHPVDRILAFLLGLPGPTWPPRLGRWTSPKPPHPQNAFCRVYTGKEFNPPQDLVFLAVALKKTGKYRLCLRPKLSSTQISSDLLVVRKNCYTSSSFIPRKPQFSLRLA